MSGMSFAKNESQRQSRQAINMNNEKGKGGLGWVEMYPRLRVLSPLLVTGGCLFK